MSQLHLMVTITDRKLTRKFIAFYEELGLKVAVIALGNGTANSEILDYFGLEGSEKGVLFHAVGDGHHQMQLTHGKGVKKWLGI